MNADKVKGDEDTRKEVGVLEAVQQEIERPKGRHPEPSRASSAHTSLLTKRLDMSEYIKTSESHAPSMNSYIREIVLPVLPPTKLAAPEYTVHLHVHWELEEYLEEKFDAEDKAKEKLDYIVTLTGEVACAQALPCGEYMQQTWPRTGAATLATIKHALLQGESYYDYSPTHSIQLNLFKKSDQESKAAASEEAATATGRPLVVTIHGLQAELVETIEQIAWFATAFRPGGEYLTGLSKFDLRIVSVPPKSLELTAELMLLPLRSYVDTEPSYGSCWLEFMTYSVLAWGFPIKERGKAVGLEMPYQLMLKEIVVKTPIEHYESIIIRQGLLTIYPSAKYDEGIQWRVVVGGSDGFFDQIETVPVQSLGNSSKSFYHSKFFDPTGNLVPLLPQMRNFVG